MDEQPPVQPGVLRVAVVVRPAAQECEVSFGRETAFARYAAPFQSRAESLTPGHLVAVATGPDDTMQIVWRWFDAVVLDRSADELRLWEPAHGEVVAQARRPKYAFAPGTRAYASAGLPRAEWWVEGPVVAVEEADVAIDEVADFYATHDLWSAVTWGPDRR